MVDAVTTRTFSQDGNRDMTVHLTNISDGTGETTVLKVDRSALTINGAAPRQLAIVSARWCIQGFTSVRLLWDHTADDTAMVLCGNGYEEFTVPYLTPNTSTDAITGTVGDLILTTAGTISGATYDITLVIRKVG